MAMALDNLGHYEILGPLGAGGMGEVYMARDPKLGRKVAIKLLPLRLTTERDTLTRFTQEARSASALNHPNIVTIHEVGASEGTPFIVMEYIDGHDLRTLINEGPVPVRKALDIACQIADGLAAAHERGIVHRDLKPENIMVTRDGFVKILDFGLAKIIAPSSDSGENTLELDLPGTNPGTILGTVGYMSPEQATGRRLDFRSDQFAFGAILYELCTGRAAFEGETAIDTLSGILHHTPQPITRVNPRAPVQLADITKRLLEKSADDRYSSSRDLARELRLLKERVVAEESGFHKSQPIDAPKKATLAVIAALALAAFITGVVFLARDRGTSQPPPAAAAAAPATKYLAVMRFKDLTGDVAGRLVVDGFGETLTARLAHYPNVQVIRSPASDEETDDVRKVARDLGANLVLSGSMMRNGQRIRVTYTVLDSHTGHEWRDLVEGSVSDLFAVQDDVADSVARNLDLGQSAAARIALDPAVSQRRYLEALGHLRRYDSEKSLDSAIGILEELGDSPSVQAALARAYLYKFKITRQPQLASSAGRAVDRALEADPQSIDVNVTLGERRNSTGCYPEAVAAFLRVLSQQPNNADAVLGLAETYKTSGDLQKAESAFKRVVELQPNFWGGYNHLGAFYFGQGRYQDALTQFQKVVQLVPDSAWGYNNLGGTLQRLGRYDDAVRIFSQSIALMPSGQAYSNLGTCYYFSDRYAQAARAFEMAVKLTPHDFLYWRNLGDAYRWMPGQEANAKRAYQRSIELSQDAIRVNPSEALAYASMASALAKLGREREARTAILHALELEPRSASHVYEAAVVANIGGAEDEAIARLEQVMRLGYNPEHIGRDPEFANLKKSGRLQSAIQGFRSTQQQNQ